MVILLKTLFVVLASCLSVFFAKRYPKPAYVVAIATAILGVVGVTIVERASVRLTDPNVKVLYLQNQKQGTVTLKIDNGSTIAEVVDVDFSVMGNVKNISHLSSGQIYGSLEKTVIGYSNPYAQNTIQIHISKLAANGGITFLISYEQPPSPTFDFIGLDMYSYRYTWNHGGETIERIKWASKTTGSEVQPPCCTALGGIGDPRMSKEGFEKLGEPPWRKFQ